jgi:choline dehydrogenase
LGRPNLRIVTHAQAHRVTFEGRSATGVEYARNGRLETLLADHVILCAGALATPKLLQLSGVGSAELLGRLGIPLVIDNPNVGRNLQEHPGVLVTTEVSVKTYNVETDPISVIRHGLDWIVRGRGPGATPIGHAVAFLKTDPGLADPDVQLTFTPIGYGVTEGGPMLHPRPAVVVAANVCRPRARGEVRLRSSRPEDLPVVSLEMLADERDLATLRAGARAARAILRSDPFAPVKGVELTPTPDVEVDADWDRFLRARTVRFSHPGGTCRMGEGDDAVVDSTLRVKGVERLYVADASIMPTLPSANTNAAAIMIGEKAADLIRGRFSGAPGPDEANTIQ